MPYQFALRYMFLRFLCISVWVEFQVARARHLALLRELSTKHSMFRSQLPRAVCLRALLLRIKRHDKAVRNRAFVGDINGSRLETVITLAVRALRSDIWWIGRFCRGIAGWCRLELLRIKGDIVRSQRSRKWHATYYSQVFAGAITRSQARSGKA